MNKLKTLGEIKEYVNNVVVPTRNWKIKGNRKDICSLYSGETEPIIAFFVSDIEKHMRLRSKITEGQIVKWVEEILKVELSNLIINCVTFNICAENYNNSEEEVQYDVIGTFDITPNDKI